MSSKFIAVLAQVTLSLKKNSVLTIHSACELIWNHQQREIDKLKDAKTKIGKSLNSAVKVSISVRKELKESKAEVEYALGLLTAIMHDYPEVKDEFLALEKEVREEHERLNK